MTNPINVTVYYDYGCPFVYRAASWIENVQAELGDELNVTWRAFPLEQTNSGEGPEWKLWEQPADHKSRGRDAFHASIAASKQGQEAFTRFHNALLALRWVDEKDHGRRDTLLAAAQTAGLDIEQFEKDLEDRSLLAQIGDDWESAKEFQVFGTPTFVFDNGQTAYLKIKPAIPAEDAVPYFRDFVATVRDRPYIFEVKRPQ